MLESACGIAWPSNLASVQNVSFLHEPAEIASCHPQVQQTVDFDGKLPGIARDVAGVVAGLGQLG